MESFLKARALSTLIALPIVVLSIWLGSYWFVALISLGGSVTSYELSSMAGGINSKTKALSSGFLSGSIILAIGILVSTINIDLFPYSVIAVVVSIFSILWIDFIILREFFFLDIIFIINCSFFNCLPEV